MKLLGDIKISGKRVFVRADLDVPVQTSNAKRLTTNATSDVANAETATRLTNLKSTVNYLVGQNAKVIIAGHIDRPSVAKALEGKPPLYDEKLSTKQLLEPLEKILGEKLVKKESPRVSSVAA